MTEPRRPAAFRIEPEAQPQKEPAPRRPEAPTVRKGWGALTRAVHPDGKFGWVQPIGDRPESVSYEDTQFYGVGAFLLAATAIADLDLKPTK